MRAVRNRRETYNCSNQLITARLLKSKIIRSVTTCTVFGAVLSFLLGVFSPLRNRWFSVDEKQDLISSLSKLVLVIC